MVMAMSEKRQYLIVSLLVGLKEKGFSWMDECD
jgi:hypothetical protein